VKHLFRPTHQGRSGYIALFVFILAYTATMALVIAPERVKSAMDAPLTWPDQ
jgi:hypothetical protein